MPLNIEYTRNGKPNIIFNNYKYRESYPLKGGEIVWRCLGRTCNATVKTDPDKTTVIIGNGKHSGPHPVTMRSLTSPSTPRTTTPNTTPNGPSAAESGTSIETALPRPSPVAAAAAVADADLPHTPLNVSSQPTCSNNTSTPLLTDIELENKLLKDEVCKLKNQLQTLLDHSIQNDLRLLEYTDQVFAPNSTSSEAENVTSKIDTGVQCSMQTECRDSRCAELKSVVCRLRTTIEVLEADNSELKNTLSSCVCKGNDNKNHKTDWVEVRQNKSAPLKVSNSYGVLSDNIDRLQSHKKHNSNNKTKLKQNKPRQKQYKPRKQTNDVRASLHYTAPKINFSFVNIESDSHGRHIAGLV